MTMDDVFNVTPGRRLWAVKDSGKIQEWRAATRCRRI